MRIDRLTTRLQSLAYALLLAVTALAVPQAFTAESEWEENRPAHVRELEAVRHGRARGGRIASTPQPADARPAARLLQTAPAPELPEHRRRDQRHGRGFNLRN